MITVVKDSDRRLFNSMSIDIFSVIVIVVIVTKQYKADMLSFENSSKRDFPLSMSQMREINIFKHVYQLNFALISGRSQF